MRKSSKARLFSTCLTGAILAAASPAWGQTSDAPTWKPRAEVDAQVGKDIGVSTSLFAPIAQNDSSLVYVDGRIGYDQRFDRNGSATIGARVRVGEDAAIGVNAGADFYRSDIGSRDQAALSLGLEGFTSVFDARVNYRLPLSKTRTIGYIDPAASGSAALVLENNRLIERNSGFRLEAVPLQGFNGEAGVRLPVGNNASIRGSVGGFTYWDKDADENYRGIRGGLEMDIEDRNSGARFTFGGTVEHDNRFGTDARATVRLSVPFGGRSGDRGAAPTGLDRQMGDRVRRDYVARSGSRYRDLTTSRFAVDARTGNEFGGFYYASGTGVAGAAGTLATPTTINDAVTRAGANGVVVALGSGGNITTPGVTLATNQYLLGGASAVDVRLINGSTAQFALGGTNGVIVGSNAAGATVTLGQGSVVRDVTIRGAGVGIAANGVGGFALDRVIVENTGGAGIALTNTLGSVALTGLTVRGGAGAGVLVTGGSSVSLANSTISGGASAVDINDGGANLAVSLSGLTLSATGGNVLDIDGSGAGTVTVTGLSGITIRGGTGETGGLSVRSATFDANTTTAGIQTVNAGRMEVGTTAARVNGQGVFLTDVTGSLSFSDLDIANSGATGLRVVNSKVNSFTLATLDGTIDTVGGTAADLDPLVIDLNFASISSIGAAGPGVILDTVQGGGTGGNALTIGTLTISNSGGDGLVILNSTGLVRVNGGAITNSGGSSVRIGTQGVAGSGGSTNLIFGASITDPTGAAAIVAIFNTSGTLNFTGPISGSGPILIQDTLTGSAITFGAITLTGTAGDAITLNNLAGSINFAGLVTIANPGANGIVIGNVPGGVTFGNVDITGLGNFTGLDVTGAHGNVLFNTLDITGTGTGAGKGIDVTGSTNAGNVIVLNASIIQGVNIGVDLTQANMTGQFRFGDGDATVLNSTIAANTPIVIALMNASNGSYNFADVNLVGDTSNLTGAGFTAYYARLGATGAGTRSDPGSLAGADASTAQYIVLLNDPTGGQDVFDAASAGGSFDLAAGQSLVSFLNGDFVAVSGAGLPANLTVSGIGPAGIANVYAGSGAAVLTTTAAGSATVNLSNNSRIDGLVIRNAGNDVGVEGVGVSNAGILNSNISGATGAIAINDGGVASSVQLLHLDLASAGGTTLALSGAGAGTLTVSGADVDIAATGTSAALSLTDVISGGLGFGTISTDTSATGAVTLQNVTGGNLVVGSVAVGGTATGAGVSVSGTSSTVSIQSISVNGSAGDALNVSGNSGSITIGGLSASSSGGDAAHVANNVGSVTIASISATSSGGDALELAGNGAVTIGGLFTSGAGGAGLRIQNSLGAINLGSGAINGAATGVWIDGVTSGTGVSISSLGISAISGVGISIADVDGSVTFSGTTNISGVGTSGIAFGGGSAGTISFGDVNITGLGAGRTGVDARNASGTVSFNTLDITGSSTAGTRGIDLTGATFATNFTTTESGSITGVGIGVDLTNAAITGSFRYGDGSNTDADGAASSINAVTPIVITGINVGTGSYNFLDVALTGDTSTLTSSATLYFVKAGATGVGTIADPGSLAGAEAAAADTIILLNDPTGGQDILDAAGAGGSFDLAAGRTLLSFLNGDTLTLPGGAPANLLLFGIPSGQIGNPFAGSGAPVLTNSGAGNTLGLASNTLVDGIIVDASNGPGIYAIGAANVTIRNSVVSASQSAIVLGDGAGNASARLSGLQLASSGGAVLNLDGSGAGTLTITGLDDITIAGGNGETSGILATGVVFDADLATAGYQAVTGTLRVGATAARIGGIGVYLDQAEGATDFTFDIATDGGSGLYAAGGVDGLQLGIAGGTIDSINAGALDYGLILQDLSSSVTLGSLAYSGAGIGVWTQNVTGIGAGGSALDIASLTVADGSAAAIAMTGSATGGFSFGLGSSIGTTTNPAAITLANTGASIFNYAGSINYAGAAAVLSVSGGHNGTVNFTGTIDATSGTGLVFDNADGTYTFSGSAALAAGIRIFNGSAGTFTFGSGASITSPGGIAVDIQDSTASFAYAGTINYGSAGFAAINVVNHSGGTIGFTGLTEITTGAGINFDNADGTYQFNGVINLDAGLVGIVIANGSSGDFTFGADTNVIASGGSALAVSSSTATIDYLGYVYAFGGNGISVTDHSVGTIDFSGATLDLNGGTTLRFDNADGAYSFGGFATTGGSGIAILNGSAGTFTFGDVDIADLGAGQTAVDLTGATGNVTFNTLDITGASTTGTRGIDLTGNTGTGDIVVTNSSTITGVGVGVDLTNASRTGLFQYGDGESAIDVASTITATTPLVIAGLNGVTGTYNFADVNLVGDTSGLATSAAVYYVLAGASGSGTLGDPGSLAGAEAAAADIIILLNDPAGGQDVLDALGSNGNDALQLDANQALRSFLNGDTITLPGGAPANVILTGVVTGVTNPYAGSGAPILTTTGAANTVTLANNSLIDGVVIQSASGFAGVYGSGVATVTLSNATLSGTGTALRLLDGGAAATATLTNLSLSASGTNAAVDFSGAGAGSLTLTGSGNSVSHSGSGALLAISDVLIGGGNLSFGNVVSTASGAGVDLGTIGGFGTLSFGSITVAGATANGVALHNSSATVDLGDVTVSGAAGTGIALTSNSGAITIGSLDISSSATGLSASGLTSTLTVGDGTIDGATVAGILIGAGNTVLLEFGDIDITGLQAGARGVDARLTGGGNVYFETLDISGASAAGTRGIDLTGNTGTGNFTVNESSSITGVGIGVDLTNASRTGGFRYGDGSNIDFDLAASTINATTPIVIAGLNGAAGTYDFRDVTLVGDTSPLEVSAFFVRAGATGVGSKADPGSLAAADASTATYIVLLDSQAGAGSFDTITGTLNLADGQSLLSFGVDDTLTVAGGAPANVYVSGITGGTITNTAPGLGAPLLTSADATGTVRLDGASEIEGVVISNSGAGAGIYANGTTGTTTLTNIAISGAAIGLSINNASGTINAANVDISGAATSAVTVSGGTAGFTFDGASSIVQAAGGLTLNVANHSIGTLAFAGLINATSGNGMQFNNADGAYNFTGITTLNGGNAGIDIYNGATGTFTFGSATNLTHNGAGNAFVLLSSANVTFDGSITDNDGVAVEIDGHDAGTATFNGTISSSIGNASTVISIVNSNGGAITFNGGVNIASTGAQVVNLSDNNGGTVTFAGGGSGLDITSTTGIGMFITGGGTVNVQGANNSITTTSGTLLSITDTGGTATAVDLSFASASNTSGANGIFVQRVGAGAITGTVNIGGGAITATTRGVSLNGDALNFTYGGTLTTSGAASRSFEATNRTGGTATLSGNLTDTSLGISIANNTGGTVNLTGQTISLNTGANTAVTLSNNAGATVNFAPLAGGNGLDIVTTGGAGISATGGGTLSVTGAGNTIQTATGQVINLTGVSAGAGGINFASLQSTGVVAGIAINLNNLDSVGGGAFSGGTTSVAATSGGNDGIFIGNGSAANVSFGATTIGTGTISGDGIEINGAGNGTVTFTSVDIDNTTAHGVSIVGAVGATGAIAINGGTIGAGGAGSIGGDGVNVTGGSGTVTVAASIAKTNNAGNVVEVSSHTGGTVTFSGNLSATGATANGILLSNNSGGTITFSGATKTLATGATNAIQFDNNAATGAAVSFTGGNLDIDTTSGGGITGTSTTAGAGSLTIQGANNTITSVGGVALNLVNTNIAAGGLNFLSISANGGARGIVLNTTGGAAGLTITGTGTTGGSGGLIQNITARGIELLNTALVNIANLNLLNANTTNGAAGDDFNHTGANSAIFMNGVATAVFENIDITGTIADNGITGINVSNFQLNNSLITGAGNGAHESGIEFSNLSGTSSLTNTEIALSETNSLDIVNTDVNLNLTLNNVIFRDTQSSGIGEGGLQFRSFSNAAGTPTTNIDVIDSDFLRIRTQGIQIIGEDDSVISVDITNSVIDSQTGIGAGIDINGNDTSTVRFNIIGNPTIRSSGGAAINITSFISANVMGRIANNADIEVYSQTPAGTGASGSGVRLLAQENSHLTVAVTGNTLTQGAGNNSAAVDVIAREGSARLDLTLTGNVIDSTDVNTLADINLQSGSSSGSNIETNQIYANIANNNLTATAAPNLLRLRVSELDNTHDPRIFLQGFVEGGAGIEDDAVATWNANGNTPGATAANIAVSLTGTATGPSAGTAQTPTNPLP